MLTFIIIAGSMLGFTSVYFMYHVDESEAMRISAKQPIWEELKRSFTIKARRQQIYVNFVVNFATAMTVPISMVALKEGYENISDNQALFFSLLQFGGAVCVSYVVRILCDETGPKPIVQLCYAVMLLPCVLWIFSPLEFTWNFAIWPFILGGIGSTGALLACVQYFL